MYDVVVVVVDDDDDDDGGGGDDGDVSFTHLQLLNSSLLCKLKVTGRACKGSEGIAIPLRAYYRARGFQEAEAARFRDNQHMNVVTLAGLRTGRLYSQ